MVPLPMTNAKKITKVKLRAPQPERAVQLARQRESLHNQVIEILTASRKK